jgi:hypothetical protein
VFCIVIPVVALDVVSSWLRVSRVPSLPDTPPEPKAAVTLGDDAPTASEVGALWNATLEWFDLARRLGDDSNRWL